MDIELISIAISVIASVFAFLSVRSIKKLSSKLEKTIYLKNSSGETKEITVDADDTNKDIQGYLNSALVYEKEVGEILKKYNSQLIHNYTAEFDKHKYHIDFVIKNFEKEYFIEVKSHKRPLTAVLVSKIIDQLPYKSDGNLIVSKSGFTESAIETIKKANKNIMAISGADREELTQQFDEFAASKGITSQVSGTP
jgi:hypothetical protein